MKTAITLKQVLLDEADKTYIITRNLFRKVSDNDLNWKPASGKNWMTMGQLLMHCASYGCGQAVKGFVRGEWEIPEEGTAEPEPDRHIPPAEQLPRVESVDQALDLLEEDWKLTRKCLEEVEESDLANKKLIAPWGGPHLSLFQHLFMMIMHLHQHKGQLFYYLKLMGKDVDTRDLWEK